MRWLGVDETNKPPLLPAHSGVFLTRVALKHYKPGIGWLVPSQGVWDCGVYVGSAFTLTCIMP